MEINILYINIVNKIDFIFTILTIYSIYEILYIQKYFIELFVSYIIFFYLIEK